MGIIPAVWCRASVAFAVWMISEIYFICDVLIEGFYFCISN